ncbi:SgrR family transcriptional regulator [Photobacterium sanguinicancri]|uniref:SgrR family transcriptional regulator n=1 Tax=Photobacterium sanguinicancri TaxID=875932 RepID=UPI003D0C3094
MVGNQSSPFINQIHLQRLKQLCEHYELHQTTKTDIPTLSEQLNCSDRNIAKLVKTLANIGWLSWQPGRGRGNKSEITLHTSFESALMLLLEQHCHKGQLSEASRYAESFGFSKTFRKRLPHWLSVAQENLKAKNSLITLVPYTVPNMHPLWSYRAASRLYIDAMYDTLLKYDRETKSIRPHIAHYYEFRDNELWLRLRSDVLFHNGEKLTAEHVATCLTDRMTKPHTYQNLYRHILNVRTEGAWVILTMTHKQPLILHILADNNASIYRETSERTIPYGTGPFMLESHNKHQWVLAKFPDYFSYGGFIDKAEFWTSDTSETKIQGHIVHHGYSSNGFIACDQVPLQTGCDIIAFPNSEQSLSMDEKAWIFHHAREFCHQVTNKILPVANSVVGYHQHQGVYLYHHKMKQPTQVIRVLAAHSNKYRIQLLKYLESKGATFEICSDDETEHTKFGMTVGGYVFSDDDMFGYFKWLICSSVFKYCLSPQQQEAFINIVDKLLLTSDSEMNYLNQLHRCEDWLIQHGIFFPLWRDSLSYNFDKSLQGADTDSAGTVSLRKLWFED